MKDGLDFRKQRRSGAPTTFPFTLCRQLAKNPPSFYKVTLRLGLIMLVLSCEYGFFTHESSLIGASR